MSGAGPPSEGGTAIGYDQLNAPLDDPAVHVAEEASEVAAKSPAPPEGAELSATSEAFDAASETSAVTALPSFVVANAVGPQAAASGVVSAQAGSDTRRSRSA